MENKSLLLFYFKHQRMRNVARRKSLARRRRRLYFILKRINENMRYLQFVQTITFAMLVILLSLKFSAFVATGSNRLTAKQWLAGKYFKICALSYLDIHLNEMHCLSIFLIK